MGENMVEELSLDMGPENKKRDWWRSPKGIVVIAALGLVLVAVLLSWWLANGTVSSLQAKMDTMVYNVEPEFATRVRSIAVHPGEEVQSGQVLASIEVPGDFAAQQQTPQNGLQGISDRLSATQAAERQMAARVAEARAEEDRLHRIYQDSVTEHVRAQLAMRSINSRNQGAYQQAAGAEMAAKSRMQAANDEFEKASKARAAMDVELNKIRAQLQRARKSLSQGLVDNALSGQTAVNRTADLYAPVTGKIMRINTESGHLANKGQTLFTILPTGDDYLTSSWIQAWFPPDSRKMIEAGQQALVRFDNGLQLTGKVKSVGDTGAHMFSAGETNSRDRHYVSVKIVLDDPFKAQNIQPGTKASCQIQTRYLLGYTWFN